MLTYKNRVLFNHDLCMQCGSCLAACSFDAISSHLNEDGTSQIVIDQDKCTGCKKCISVCPAGQLQKEEFDLFQFLNKSNACLAYSADNAVRNFASSGGVARTLLKAGLESAYFDAVYTLEENDQYPFAEGKFFNTSSTKDKVSRSVYHPVLVNQNLKTNDKFKRLLVIGTACQLYGVEKLLRGKVKELYTLCIFCKQQKTFESTRFIAKMNGFSNYQKEIAKNVSYRGNGWPGEVVTDEKSMKYEQAAALPFGRRLWRVNGCKICPNPFGASADLTLMDPWGIEKENELGKNLIFVNTLKGKELIERFNKEIILEKVDASDVKKSINVSDVLRKQVLVNYYLGEKVPALVCLGGVLERIQTFALEQILMKVKLPKIAYKVLAHLPDLRNLFLK